MPSQTMAIEGGSVEKGQEKEWYYGNDAKERNGPVGFSDLKDLFKSGGITAKTKVWAQGMEGWRLLQQVNTNSVSYDYSSLLSTVCSLLSALCSLYLLTAPIFSAGAPAEVDPGGQGHRGHVESEVATSILKILIRMTSNYPSRDADGAIIRPLPTVKRVLTEPNSLPHIVQLLVTFDPVLVEQVWPGQHHLF